MSVSTFTVYDQFNIRNVKIRNIENFLKCSIINTEVNHLVAVIADSMMVRVFLVFKLSFIAIEVEFLEGAIFCKRLEVAVDGDEVDMRKLCMHLRSTHAAMVCGYCVKDFLAVFGLTHSC